MAETTTTLSEPTASLQTAVNPITYQTNPTQAYSASNLTQTAYTPLARPDLTDPFGVYNYYMNSPEVQAARGEVSSLQQAINQSNQALRSQTTAIENAPMALNVIRGAQAQARSLQSNELQALSENMLAKQSYLDSILTERQNQYQIALNEREKLQDLIRQTGGKAKISYTDNYESALVKATKYLEKKAQKDTIKELYLQTFGSTGKGKSTKELEKKLKKYFKSSKEYEDQVKSISLQTSKIQLQKLQADLAKLNQKEEWDPASAFDSSSSSATSPTTSGTNINQSPFNSIYG